MEEFVQGRLDAQLLGGVLVVQRTRESLVEETRRGGDRELFLVRHRHGELVFIVLRLGLEVRHHKVPRVYRLPRIPSAVLLPFVIIAGTMKTALARHRRWFSIHQFRLHLGIDSLLDLSHNSPSPFPVASAVDVANAGPPAPQGGTRSENYFFPIPVGGREAHTLASQTHTRGSRRVRVRSFVRLGREASHPDAARTRYCTAHTRS